MPGASAREAKRLYPGRGLLPAQVGEQPSSGPARRWHRDDGSEVLGAAGVIHHERGDRQQLDGQPLRQRICPAGRLPDVPAMHGDLDRPGGNQQMLGEWQINRQDAPPGTTAQAVRQQ
jgi:hypothetical protein